MIIPVAENARSSVKSLTVVLILLQLQWKPTRKLLENTWKHSRILKALKNVSISATWRGIFQQSIISLIVKSYKFLLGISITIVWPGTAWVTNICLTNIQTFGTRRFVIWRDLLMVLLMQHSWLPGSLFTFVPHRNTQNIMLQLGKIFGVLRFIKIITSNCNITL